MQAALLSLKRKKKGFLRILNCVTWPPQLQGRNYQLDTSPPQTKPEVFGQGRGGGSRILGGQLSQLATAE